MKGCDSINNFMKRSMAFLFSFLLLFFSLNPYIVFAQIDGTSSSSGGSTLPVNIDINFDDLTKFYKAIWGDFTYKDGWDYGWNLGTAPIQWAKEQLSNFMDDSGKVDTSNPDSPIQSDGTYIYINQNFVNGMNKQVQDSVHALDGYYLLDNVVNLDDLLYEKYIASSSYGSYYENYCTYKDKILCYNGNGYFCICDYANYDNLYFYCNPNLSYVQACLVDDNLNHTSVSLYRISFTSTTYSPSYIDYCSYFQNYLPRVTKVFYSLTDLKKYVSRNGRQYYAPNINTGGSGLKIPVQAITNNTINNISQNINITYEGKTEAEIQAQIDASINQRLQELLDNMATPTPTPNPDTTDIPIVTPIPDSGGGTGNTGNTGDTTSPFIEKIYNWLVSFGEKHDTFEKKLSTYLEDNNTKLDTIITALDKIGTGQTTGEENGCKYDYTALSEFLTNLWNESYNGLIN